MRDNVVYSRNKEKVYIILIYSVVYDKKLSQHLVVHRQPLKHLLDIFLFISHGVLGSM